MSFSLALSLVAWFCARLEVASATQASMHVIIDRMGSLLLKVFRTDCSFLTRKSRVTSESYSRTCPESPSHLIQSRIQQTGWLLPNHDWMRPRPEPDLSDGTTFRRLQNNGRAIFAS